MIHCGHLIIHNIKSICYTVSVAQETNPTDGPTERVMNVQEYPPRPEPAQPEAMAVSAVGVVEPSETRKVHISMPAEESLEPQPLVIDPTMQTADGSSETKIDQSANVSTKDAVEPEPEQSVLKGSTAQENQFDSLVQENEELKGMLAVYVSRCSVLQQERDCMSEKLKNNYFIVQLKRVNRVSTNANENQTNYICSITRYFREKVSLV